MLAVLFPFQKVTIYNMHKSGTDRKRNVSWLYKYNDLLRPCHLYLATPSLYLQPDFRYQLKLEAIFLSLVTCEPQR